MTGAACSTCGQPLWNAPRAPVAHGEWGGGNAKTFKILAVAPLVVALVTATFGYWRFDPGAILFGVSNIFLALVSAVYCGAWLAKRIAKNELVLFLLRLVLPLVLLFINMIIVSFGCGVFRHW
jgi:hypothetical protein